MDLETFFPVKRFQGAVVRFEVLPFGFQRVPVGDDGHRVAQDGNAVVQFDDAQFVHEQQRLLEQGFAAVCRNLYRQLHIVGKLLHHFADSGFHDDIFPPDTLCLADEKGQDAGADVAAQKGGFLNIFPAVIVFEADFQAAVAEVADFKAAVFIGFECGFVVRKRQDELLDFGGRAFQSRIVHFIADGIDGEILPYSLVGIGNFRFQYLPEFFFPSAYFFQKSRRRFDVVGTQDDGHARIVGQYAHFFEAVQVSAQFFQAACGRLYQVVGTERLVIRCVEYDFGNGQVDFFEPSGEPAFLNQL